MRSVPLRLFLLVCVAAMLRPDACQTQGQPYLTPTEFAAALLIHFGAETGSDASTTTPAQSKVSRPVRPVASYQTLSLSPAPSPAQASAAAPQAGHTRFKARSSLPADAEPALA